MGKQQRHSEMNIRIVDTQLGNLLEFSVVCKQVEKRAKHSLSRRNVIAIYRGPHSTRDDFRRFAGEGVFKDKPLKFCLRDSLLKVKTYRLQ